MTDIAPRILTLTLKKKWFDMIASGEKKEEYRAIKQYWRNRLTEMGKYGRQYKVFTHVRFRNGYQSDAPEILVECLGIGEGTAKPEWSDNWQGRVIVIKLGELIYEL